LDGKAVVLLLSCCTLWGLNQIAVKLALPEVPPLTQLAIRCSGAAVLVLLWAALRQVPMGVNDRTLRPGVLAGTLFAAEFACIFVGLQFTSASRMTVFLYLAPFVVALGMPFIARHERLSALQWLGLAVAFCGVAVAFSEGLSAPAVGPRQWWGDALGILAAVLWGVTTLVVRASSLAGAAPEKTLAYQLGISGLLISAVVLAGPLPLWVDAARALSPLSIASLVFQTVVVTFASYLVWFWLVRHYAATRLASVTLLTPVAGLIFGVLILSEPLTPQLLAALSTVVVGLLLINRASAKPPAHPSNTTPNGDP
jgi:drug/metabolite transporter (DMT)-like permease